MFKLRKNDICLFTKYQTFGENQTERLCRRQSNNAKLMGYASARLENIVGKRENAGYQYFVLFHKVLRNFLNSESW